MNLKSKIKFILNMFLFCISFSCVICMFLMCFIARMYDGTVIANFNHYNEMELEFWLLLTASILQITYGMNEFCKKQAKMIINNK